MARQVSRPVGAAAQARHARRRSVADPGLCHETGTAIVPQGGNTGLVGGQIPLHGEVLLSTQRLNKVRALDESGMTLTVEAGVTLGEAQRAAADSNLLFPLSLASEGSCTIGGNIATNAGGTHVLRYGMTRALVLGLEVVLANGTVLPMLRALHKDNSGYDLKQLFIGSEGTLGVITAACLRLFPKPDVAVTALAAVPSPAAAVKLLGAMQAHTGGMLSAFELMPRIALEFVTRHIDGTRDPLAAPAPWYVLMEASGGAHANLAASFEDGLAAAIGDGVAADAVVASSQGQALALWKLRESISEAQKREGASIKHDIAVPVAAIPDFLARAVPAVLARGARGAPRQLRPSGRRQPAFQFQCARRGRRSALSCPMGRGAAGGARYREGIFRLDQRRAWHRGDEAGAAAALQVPCGTGCDAGIETGLRPQEYPQSGQTDPAGAAALMPCRQQHLHQNAMPGRKTH